MRLHFSTVIDGLYVYPKGCEDCISKTWHLECAHTGKTLHKCNYLKYMMVER